MQKKNTESSTGKDKLLPCPHCGGEAYVKVEPILGSDCTTEYSKVGCKECFDLDALFETKQQAIDAWNSRRVEDNLKSKYSENSILVYDYKTGSVQPYLRVEDISPDIYKLLDKHNSKDLKEHEDRLDLGWLIATFICEKLTGESNEQ